MGIRAKENQDTNVPCRRREYKRKNVEAAIEEVRKHLNNAKPSVYRIRIIHGYHGGTRIREFKKEQYLVKKCYNSKLI